MRLASAHAFKPTNQGSVRAVWSRLPRIPQELACPSEARPAKSRHASRTHRSAAQKPRRRSIRPQAWPATPCAPHEAWLDLPGLARLTKPGLACQASRA
eukprot:365124-Chlamydomonas_euryale.AAC.17